MNGQVEAHCVAPMNTGQMDHSALVRSGIVCFLASEAALFVTLFAVYALFAREVFAWDEARTQWSAKPLLPATVLLALASASLYRGKIQLEGSVSGARRWLWVAALWGTLFVVAKVGAYTHEIRHGFVPERGPFWQFYYLLSGLHLAHVVAGIAAVLWVASVRAPNLAAWRARWQGLLAYWGFVDAVWLVLLYLFLAV
jgi:heme/copper-type cytochrome/quinol oxidase subunit 3